LNIKKGEVLGLVGESGSGKTQTALNLVGLSNSYPGIVQGEIQFNFDEEKINILEKLPEYTFKSNGKYTKNQEGWIKQQNELFETIWGNKISIIFQDPLTSLNPYKTVGFHLLEALRHYSVNFNKEALRDLAIQWLDRVKIQKPDHVFHSYPFELSGGMAQRVMIAIALASEPEFLILDEPTTGLDVTTQASIVSLLKEIKESKNITQLLITHDLGLVSHLADKIAVMYAGNLLEYGPKEDILDKNNTIRHPYTEGLLASLYRGYNFNAIENDVPNIMQLPSGCPFHPRCPYYLHSGDKFLNKKCKVDNPDFTNIKEGYSIRCWRYNYEKE
jgi:oligopeptide/dipeptide ABC transporter ATP-binding protein